MAFEELKQRQAAMWSAGDVVSSSVCVSFAPDDDAAARELARKEELHRAYVDFDEGHRRDGSIAAPRECLLTLRRKK